MLERAAAAALLAAAGLHAQTASRILTVVSTADGSEQPYALYIPRSVETPKQCGLLVSLHSEESDHRLNLTQVLGVVPRDPGLIVACPLARGTMGYQGIAEQDVYDVLADVERRYPIDPDRVYLTGISMGGAGALRLDETRPDIWAGVAAMCPDSMPGSQDLAANLLNVPVRLYHGELDAIVPVSSSRTWQRWLLDAGVPAAYTEYPATRHNVWELAYNRGGALEWLAGLRRNRSPERVRLVADSYQYNVAYWVRIDSLTPGVAGQIDARRSASGDVAVVTKNIEGFTLTAPVANITIDRAPVHVDRSTAFSFTRTAAGWRQGLAAPSGKRLGAEGPMVRALSGRQIYVYGTLGASGDEEIAERRKVAETGANWSSTRTHLQLSFSVKADRDLTAQDVDSADLILFGTAENNALIARWAGNLPLALRPDAADYGLVFIAPLGKHYVLVNSGLPWWSGADESTGSGYRWAPAPYRLLSGFGDYVLFRGSIAQVAAEGRFDANWKVPAGAVARLTASGTVSVR